MLKVETHLLPRLGRSEDEAKDLVTSLQGPLLSMWNSIRTMNDAERTIVVVPSQTLDFQRQGAEMPAHEERFLFLLLLLQQARVRIVYVTSQTVPPSTVDSYLNLLPREDRDDARKRLFMVAPEDHSNRPLARKLLERPGLVAQIRALIPDRNHAHLISSVTTKLERDLALLLGIPVYVMNPVDTAQGTEKLSREGGCGPARGSIRGAVVELGGRAPRDYVNRNSVA